MNTQGSGHDQLTQTLRAVEQTVGPRFHEPVTKGLVTEIIRYVFCAVLFLHANDDSTTRADGLLPLAPRHPDPGGELQEASIAASIDEDEQMLPASMWAIIPPTEVNSGGQRRHDRCMSTHMYKTIYLLS